MALPIYDNIPELSSEANAIARRRKIAEMMLAHSQEQQPANQMAGQVVAPVSFTQGLAQLANAYLGNKQAQDADKAEQGLANKRQQMVADALAKIKQTSQGSAGVEGIEAQPARTIQAPAPMQEGQVAPNFNTVPEAVPAVAGRETVPAVAPNKRQAVLDAIMSNLPEVQKYGAVMQGFEELDIKNAQLDETRMANIEQKKLDREAKMEQIQAQIASREAMGQQTNDLRAEMANLQAETRRDIAAMASADRRYAVDTRSADKSAGKSISNIDAKSIDKSLEKSSNANSALQLLDQAEALYNKYDSGRAAPILGPLGRVGAAVGVGSKKKAQDYETADQIAKDLGVIKLGLIGGSDTERELQVAIDTSPSPDKLPATNKNIIANQRRAIQVLQAEPDFKTEWVNKHGSLSATDSANGDTYGKAWRKYQKDNFKPVATGGTEVSGKINTPNSSRGFKVLGKE